LEHNADVNYIDATGDTPLIMLIRRGNNKLLPLLIEYGANVNTPDGIGMSPLMIASINLGDQLNHHQTMILFLENGANINYHHPKHGIVLDVLYYHNRNDKSYFNLVKLFLDYGLDLKLVNQCKNSFITCIASTNNDIALPVIQLLFDAGLKLDYTLAVNTLYIFSKNRHYSCSNYNVIKLLYEHYHYDTTVLSKAAMYAIKNSNGSSNLNIVKLLLELGADIHYVNHKGDNMITTAINYVDTKEDTWSHFVFEPRLAHSRSELIKYLIDMTLATDVLDYTQIMIVSMLYTPIHFLKETIQILLDYGTNLNNLNYLPKNYLLLMLIRIIEDKHFGPQIIPEQWDSDVSNTDSASNSSYFCYKISIDERVKIILEVLPILAVNGLNLNKCDDQSVLSYVLEKSRFDKNLFPIAKMLLTLGADASTVGLELYDTMSLLSNDQN